MSGAFKLVYERLFPVRLKDPSCPYLLITRPALDRVLVGDLGILTQGFWWEFNARAAGAGLKVTQVPVSHRVRAAGVTQVYKPRRIPGIATKHLRGLWALRADIARCNARDAELHWPSEGRSPRRTPADSSGQTVVSVAVPVVMSGGGGCRGAAGCCCRPRDHSRSLFLLVHLYDLRVLRRHRGLADRPVYWAHHGGLYTTTYSQCGPSTTSAGG